MIDDFLIFLKKTKKVEIVENKSSYTCDLIDCDEEKIVISYPLISNSNLKIAINKELNLYFYTDEGIFTIRTNVININSEKIILNYPDEVNFSQRREFLRAQINVPYVLTRPNGEEIEGVIQNICAKGVNLFLKKKLEDLNPLKIEFSIDNYNIETDCTLVYSNAAQRNGKIGFSTSFIMNNLSEETTRFLIKKCFDYQLRR